MLKLISASTASWHFTKQIDLNQQRFANSKMYKTNTLYSLVIFKQVSNYSIYNEEYVTNLSIFLLNEEW